MDANPSFEEKAIKIIEKKRKYLKQLIEKNIQVYNERERKDFQAFFFERVIKNKKMNITNNFGNCVSFEREMRS